MYKKGKIALVLSLFIVGLLILSLVLAKPGRDKPACMDKKDNDGDGLVDLDDPGCDDKFDTDEYNAPPIFCGDGACNGDETCDSCEADCGICPAVCGDGVCEQDETCSNCESDCGICPPICGDGVCELGEDCSSCENDCGACIFCGDNVCNGNEDCESCEADCGSCPVPDSCTDTDGGWDFYQQGTASGYNNEVPFTETDRCLNSALLLEHACLGNNLNMTAVDCRLWNATQCINGACI